MVTPLRQELREIAETATPPDQDALGGDLTAALAVLYNEKSPTRPLDIEERPGGLVYLRPDLPTVIVPDIHARVDLVLSVLSLSLLPWGVPGALIDALSDESAQLLFLGDYVHAEARAARRWLIAFEEFQDDYSRHSAIDQEMAESLAVVRLIALLKSRFPPLVHCLKGNHENIANEHRDGNIPFGKFAYEGAMVAEYMRRFYPSVFDLLYDFEKALPLVAVGPGFTAGHAEPARFFGKEEIINHRRDPEVVAGLTWTANDAAASGSVAEMLTALLPERAAHTALYFGGHRPIKGLYNLRAEGRYVQLHNPDRFVAAVIPTERSFELDGDIIEVPQSRAVVDG